MTLEFISSHSPNLSVQNGRQVISFGSPSEPDRRLPPPIGRNSRLTVGAVGVVTFNPLYGTVGTYTAESNTIGTNI